MRFTLNYSVLGDPTDVMVTTPPSNLSEGLVALRLPDGLVRWNQVNAGMRTVRIWLKSLYARNCIGVNVTNDFLENCNIINISLEDGIDNELNQHNLLGTNFSQVLATLPVVHEGAAEGALNDTGLSLVTNAVIHPPEDVAGTGRPVPIHVWAPTGPQYALETYLPAGMWLRLRFRSALKNTGADPLSAFFSGQDYFNFLMAPNSQFPEMVNLQLTVVVDVD